MGMKTERVAVAFGVGVAVVALVASAALLRWRSEGDHGEIHACRNDTNGLLRVVGSEDDCRPHETPISWRRCDVCGGGLTSFDALNGLVCATSAGAGTISIVYSTTGLATIRCVVASTDGGTADAGSTDVSGLKINEFLTGSGSASDPQYVEIFNASGFAVSAGGVQLDYRAATGTTDIQLGTIPAGTTIPASGFYLFASDNYAGTAEQRFSTRLDFAGGGVGLRDPSAALIDSVGWGTATNAFVEGTPAVNPAVSSESAGRVPDGTDSNDNSLDFKINQPTPDQPNTL